MMIYSMIFYAGVARVALGLLLFLPIVLIVLDVLFRSLFLVVVAIPKRLAGPDTGNEPSGLRLLILVVARNEQQIITQTLEQVRNQTTNSNFVDLALLADNCMDETANISARMGVKTYLRTDGEFGKSRALSWFVAHASEDLAKYDLIAILDADTIIPADFCERVCCAFNVKDIQVIQSFVEPVNSDGFSLATLAAYSEILSQKIDDEARSRLGWTIPLRGMGMVFRRELFSRVCLGLETQVEDIEISIRLAEMKVPVTYFPLVRIFDPKGDSMLGLARQRGRWLRGQRDIWRGLQHKTTTLLRLGFPGWSLMYALLLKPKIALTVIKLTLLIVISYPGLDPYLILRGVVILSLFVDLIYYIIGLRHVSNPQGYLISFLSAPLYLGMWILGWFYSLSNGSIWLRSRK